MTLPETKTKNNKTTPDRIIPAGGFLYRHNILYYSFIICSFAAVCRARA